MVVTTLVAAGLSCGCVSKGKYDALLTQNRSLSEQNRAQLTEIENLKVHSTNTEDLLRRTEEDVALMEEQFGLDQEQLAQSRSQSDALRRQVAQSSLDPGLIRIPEETRKRLIKVSDRTPGLKFDPQTGIAKFEYDILFDSGETQLKPDAQKALAEVAAVLNTRDASDLRVFIAGHTDRQRIARRSPDGSRSTNFDLSTARALAVAHELDRRGVKNHRLAVAGFGPSQPIAPNVTARDRRKNRRVELFLTAPEVPIVGWVETIPSVY
jgi:chemotaxis protein MotB